MNIEMRHERRRLLKEIDRLNGERCKKCADTPSTQKMVHCKCASAVKIRKIGEALITTSGTPRQQRIDRAIQKASKSGLTMDIYRLLCEHELTNLEIRKSIGMTALQLTEWKKDTGLSTRPGPKESKAGYAAERSGLTVEGYLKEKSKGRVDRDIWIQYKISQGTLTSFKKKHGIEKLRWKNGVLIEGEKVAK